MSPRTPRRAAHLTAGRRGYTVIELMMAIAVFGIGVSGIIAMQKVTLSANRHAKALSVATHIAQTWIEALQADAALWNLPSQGNPGAASDLAETAWLSNAESSPNVWLRPAYDGNLLIGAGFDALGNPVPDASVADQVFCTHVRYRMLNPGDQGMLGNGLIRVEVRVFWLREGGGGGLGATPLCDLTNDPEAVGEARDRYHFVYKTTSVRQNAALTP